MKIFLSQTSSLYKRIIFIVSIYLISGQVIAQVCPTNEADFQNGGNFTGPCTLEYGNSSTISGPVVWTGGTLDLRDMDNGGLIIANGGSFTIQSGTVLLNDNDGGGGNNDAFIEVETGGTLTIIAGTLEIEKDLDINGGTVDIQSGGVLTATSGGDIDMTGGSLTVAGTLNSDDDMTVSGGTVTIPSGGVLNTDDNVTISGGTVTIEDGGGLNTGVATGTGTLNINGGDLVVDGNLDVDGDVNVTSGGLNGSGTITDVAGTFTDNVGGSFSSCAAFPCVAPISLDIQGAPSSFLSISSFTVTFEFGSDVTNFAIDDITIGNATTGALNTVDANTYTLLITPSSLANVTINVAADVVTEGNLAASETVIHGLAPGDVMFLAYGTASEDSADGDGIAFVTLVDIPANQVIYFSDEEYDIDANAGAGGWTNSGFDFTYTWTNDASVLPAGSVIVIYGDDQGDGGDFDFTTEGGGTTTWDGGAGTPSMRNQDEVMYLYTADSPRDDASTVFLTALATDGFTAANGELPASLTIGETAIEFTGNPDILIYDGSASCDGTISECQQQLSDVGNWVSEEPSNPGNGAVEWPPAPGSPVDTDIDFNGGALPVTLISFSGSLYEGQEIAQLSWVTSSEVNNEGFYIEKSPNGIDFEEIGFVEGNGTTTEIQRYAFYDYNINASYYYRLRQVDYDGQFEVSPSIYISVITSNLGNSIKIYPNPTNGQIQLSGLTNEIYDIQVKDISGKVLSNFSEVNLTDAEIGINQTLINFNNGLYMITFATPRYSETIRLIKN